MKIVTVVGARPQFIKAAAVSRAIARRGDLIDELIVHTGQHFDENMSAIFFKEMEIPQPAYHLGINTLSHGAMTGRMLEAIETVLLKERPDAVLVYGDTNSTLAGALAAKKLCVPVVHVEAGLRSFNLRMPEEINRILTDRISDLLCCPTDTAVHNLRDEGITPNGVQQIVKTGDVMLDAVRYYRKRSFIESKILDCLSLQENTYVLCTLHRAENTSSAKRLGDIMRALARIAEQCEVVLPLHPRTRQELATAGIDIACVPSGLHIVEPVGYFDMLRLLESAQLVVTDSGGLQKEAFFFQRPCITLRDETEWSELVDGGYNVLAGADTAKILAAYQQMCKVELDFNVQLYGDGNAADLIVERLATFDTN